MPGDPLIVVTVLFLLFLLANSNPNLVLDGKYYKKGFLGFSRRVEVTAFCSRHLDRCA